MTRRLTKDLVTIINAAVAHICDDSDDEEDLIALKAIIPTPPLKAIDKKRRGRKRQASREPDVAPPKWVTPSRFEDSTTLLLKNPKVYSDFCKVTLAPLSKCICTLHKEVKPFIFDYQDCSFLLNADFKTHFNMSRTTVEFIYQKINISQKEPDLAMNIIEFLSTLWSLTTCEDIQSMAERFKVDGSLIAGAKNKFFKLVLEHRFEFERWPSGALAQFTSSEMQKLINLKRVFGVVDCVHFFCDGLPYPGQYRNINGDSTVIYELVCNHRGSFIFSTYFWWPGKVTIQEIHENSPLLKMTMTPDLFLLGSRHYIMKKNVITPYNEDEVNNECKKIFNDRHASGQRILKDAVFSLLSRFTSLLELRVQNLWTSRQQFATCLILHNICIDLDDEIQIDSTLREESHFLPPIFPVNQDVEKSERDRMALGMD